MAEVISLKDYQMRTNSKGYPYMVVRDAAKLDGKGNALSYTIDNYHNNLWETIKQATVINAEVEVQQGANNIVYRNITNVLQVLTPGPLALRPERQFNNNGGGGGGQADDGVIRRENAMQHAGRVVSALITAGKLDLGTDPLGVAGQAVIRLAKGFDKFAAGPQQAAPQQVAQVEQQMAQQVQQAPVQAPVVQAPVVQQPVVQQPVTAMEIGSEDLDIPF